MEAISNAPHWDEVLRSAERANELSSLDQGMTVTVKSLKEIPAHFVDTR